jgi:hypothetical protein
MKIAVVCATLCIAISPIAIAQQGGYPASPSHGVVGPPNTDGSLHYGNEPAKDAKPNPDTVGRNGSNSPNGRSVERSSEPANASSGGTRERRGNPGGR